MWTPTDIAALPTKNDLIDAKSAIKAVETKLEDALLALAQAQLRVDTIEKDLRERKAWIAPIRKLPLDVLSLIFEVCGEDDWATPIHITRVSRQWRELVLTTPRAWAFLNMEECEADEDIARYFFKHSGQRPLHVWLPEYHRLTLLSDVTHRIRCLSIWYFPPEDFGFVFPHVESLTIRSDTGLDVVSPSDIAIDRFPALLQLLCSSPFGAVTLPPSPIAPLQALSLVMADDPIWFDLLSSCKDTLLFLRLDLIYEPTGPLPGSIVLSRLKSLETQYWMDEPDLWPLTLFTPLLETYVENSHVPNESPLHQDVGRVKSLRLDSVPTLSTFPALVVLQLEDTSSVDSVLSQLLEEENLCPELRSIEVLAPLEMGRLNDRVAEINVNRHAEGITLVQIIRTALICIIAESPCGEGLPCSK